MFNLRELIKDMAISGIHSMSLDEFDLSFDDESSNKYGTSNDVDSDFMNLGSRVADLEGTVILMSGLDMDCSRYHIIGASPWLSFKSRGRNMELCVENEIIRFSADPFDTLRTLLETFRIDSPDLPRPLGAGLSGYFAYDLKDCIEALPRTSVDDLGLPHISLFAHRFLLVFDKNEQKTQVHIPVRNIEGRNCLQNDKDIFYRLMKQKSVKAMGNGTMFGNANKNFESNFTKSAYMDSVRRIKEYIASGHVYQVNMSQRFETDFTGSGFELFKKLYKLNPAPFFSYVNAGDHQIVSTSPERFILLDGDKVETRPIKGTRPRGNDSDQDLRLKQELLSSRKDDAELSMIVDLLRNDIGKVCKEGSVEVKDHKRLEAYANVYHMVSVVEGIIDKDKDAVDLIKATFPGGSITGCPKIRAMEIIDELEPNRRHIYTGSIGYISFHDTMDLSIAIRTATIVNNKVIFSVGGGIVYDSDPADEYDETLHKGHTLMTVFDAGKTEENVRAVKQPVSWVNGRMIPAKDAVVPVSSPGFQYGFGFFETIRVKNKEIYFLEDHIKRFNHTWSSLFKTSPPDLTWKDIIEDVIELNHFDRSTAAVKIIAAHGEKGTLRKPCDHFLCVTARQYTHRLEALGKKGIDIATYPFSRQSLLANHKTLNYLYYYLAGKWAAENGADEALILNPDNTISECNTSNIFLIKDMCVIIPKSLHVLPGIMENRVISWFESQGFEIKKKSVLIENIFSADHMILTNSLMGAVPVFSLDGKEFAGKKKAKNIDICHRINDCLLS